MKYLRRLWVRIILSLLVGGMFAEIVHIKLGNTSGQTSSILYGLELE